MDKPPTCGSAGYGSWCIDASVDNLLLYQICESVVHMIDVQIDGKYSSYSYLTQAELCEGQYWAHFVLDGDLYLDYVSGFHELIRIPVTITYQLDSQGSMMVLHYCSKHSPISLSIGVMD
ncbi:hypothetical protein STEG23_022561 [Scotinomys teguina]